ncbi:MAG: sulfatase-like hydrolase/transferase, partial [Deltaproteobacteria bacterium]
IDTLRADRVGAYGYEGATTPTLDDLVDRGVVFETALSTVPLTLPAHASILTAQLPPRHGVRHNGLFRLPDEAETLAEILLAEGYTTVAVVGSVVLGRQMGLRQGFAHYDDAGTRRAMELGGFLERSAAEVTDRALERLDGIQEPFFLWVHYYDPHKTWRAPEAWRKRFPDRPYDAEIAYADAELGRLLDALDRGVRTRTLVAVTSDHGEGLGEHGEATHAYTLYDATLRVPMVLAGPGVPEGRRVREVVSLVDLAPTLAVLVGAPRFRDADGRDLGELWRGGHVPRSGAYSESLAGRLDHGWAPVYSWRSATHRYVRAPRPELYSLEEDPAEIHNLLTDSKRGSERRLAEEYARSIEDVLAEDVGGERRTLDPKEREKLAALGYAVAEVPAVENQLDVKDGMSLLDIYRDAVQALGSGDFAAARVAFEAVLRGMPDSAMAHGQMGRTLASLGLLEAGLRHAARAVELVPSSGEHLASLAMMEVQAGRLDEAAEHFRQALHLDPNLSQCHAGVMWVAAREGDAEGAERHEARALSLDPQGWLTRQWLASFWLQLGRADRAVSLLEEALELEPSATLLHGDLAVALISTGRRVDAAAHLARLGDLEADPILASRIAIAHASAGDGERALELFQRITRRHPQYGPAQRNLASLRRYMGRARGTDARASRSDR